MAFRRLSQLHGVFRSNFKMQLRAMSTSGTEDIPQFLDNIFKSPDLGSGAIENKCKKFCSFYRTLDAKSRTTFLGHLAQRYGISHEKVVQGAQSLVSSKERGEAFVVQTMERLRSAMTPQYQSLFQQIGQIDGGVKFLVDMRADLLQNCLQGNTSELDSANFNALNRLLRELLTLWFSTGFLELQRITWTSPCDLVQKISDYEGVHPIRNWTDLKQRVGPYRRCYVFTHRSMPREPIVVLHTALTSEISSSIHSIIRNPRFRANTLESSTSSSSSSSSPSSTSPVVENNSFEEEENPAQISAAVFYSITSTQKGLQGVELGNYLIKSVVQRLQSEFPHISQFSSLSPIPGFREWLLNQINPKLHRKEIGEDDPDQHLLLPSEVEMFERLRDKKKHASPLETFKHFVQSNQWLMQHDAVAAMQKTLLRLCARYLYLEKRRGMALNPVAKFHLSNGAVMWRINFSADTSIRGLAQSCGMMVNYRYYLSDTETNSKDYLHNYVIKASPEVMDFVKQCPTYTPASGSSSQQNGGR